MEEIISIEGLIINIGNQLSQTDPSQLSDDTVLRDIDGWSSLEALFVMLMIDEKYKVNLSGDDITDSSTIKDLYDTILRLKK